MNFTAVTSGTGDVALQTAGTTLGTGMTLGTLEAGSASNNVTLTGGVEFTLSAATAGASQTTVSTGTVVLDNADLLVSRSPSTYNPPLNTVFTLIASPQSISGTFNGYTEGSTIDVDGIFLTVNYTADVTLTAGVGEFIYVYSGWTGTPEGATVNLPASVGGVTTAVLGYNAFVTIAEATTQAGAALGTDAVFIFAGADSVASGTYAESVTVDSSINYTFEMEANRPGVDAANATMAATAGPALVFSGTPGDVTVTGGVFGTTADSSTLSVTTGNLTLRGATVTETANGSQAALAMTGGTADLGNVTSAGNNTFVTLGAGNLVSLADSATSNVSALGNAFTINGTPYTQPLDQTAGFAIENAVVHKMDGTGDAGLVTWESGNVYVTTDQAASTISVANESGIQRGVDVVAGSNATGPYTVNIQTGEYDGDVTINSTLTLAAEAGATVAANDSITLESGANLAATSQLNLTAETVNVNTGARLVDGLALIDPDNANAVVNWEDMFVNPTTSTNEGSTYSLTINDMGAEALALYAANGAAVEWGDGLTTETYSGTQDTYSHLYTDSGNYVPASGNPGTTNPFPALAAQIFAGTRSQLRGTLARDVNNVAPTAAFSRSPSGTVPFGTSVTAFFFGQNDVSSVDKSVGFRYQYSVNGGAFGAVGYTASTTVAASSLNAGQSNTITGRIIDKDGGQTEYTVTFDVAAAPPTPFSVSTATWNASGVDVTFSEAIAPATLALYQGQVSPGILSLDVNARLVEVGSPNVSIPVSAVLNDAYTTVSFVATGDVLAAGTYRLTIDGGVGGVENATGTTLASTYTSEFTVSASSAPVVGIPDFARGPDQSVVLPATSATPGIAVTASDATGAVGADFWFTYDSRYLTVDTATITKGANVPGDWTLTVNEESDGDLRIVKVALNGSTAVPVESGADLVLVNLPATTLSGAAYGQTQVLTVSNANVGFTQAVGDRAIHKVSFVGDANQSGTYQAIDATLISRVVVDLDSGFAEANKTDPVIVADVSNTGGLLAADAGTVMQQVAGLNPPLIPTPISVISTFAPAGIDPTLTIGSGITGAPGQTVVVPVTIDIENGATPQGTVYDVTYDPAVLEFVTATNAGTFWGDFGFTLNAAYAADTIRIVMSDAEGTAGPATGVITNLSFKIKDSAPAGTSALDIAPDEPAIGDGLTWTGVDGSIAIVTDPPEVEGVYVYSTSWTSTFKDYLGTSNVGDPALGYEIPTSADDPDQLKSIPWTKVNQIRVTFSEDVAIPSGEWADYFKITGINAVDNGDGTYTAGTYTPGNVTYEQIGGVGGVWTATWSLPGTGVFTADKLMVNVSGDIVSKATGIKLAGAWTNPTTGGGSVMPSGGEAKTPGQPFNFRVNMLPGAVTGAASVGQLDVLSVRQGLNATAGNARYTVFRDLQGQGSVGQLDLLAVRQRLRSALPAGEPEALFETTPIGGSMMMASASSTDGSMTLSDAQRLAWASLGGELGDGDGSLKKKTN